MHKAALMVLVVTLASLFDSGGHKPEVHLVVLLHRVGRVSTRGRIVPTLLHRVWRVDAQGQITPFPYEFPNSYLDSVQGSTKPLPSPDGHWIAYGDRRGNYDIHLLDVRTLRQHRITYWGKPPTISSVSVDALIDGWSPDSRRLLIYVTRGEDTSESGRLAIPKACYGFYEYDVGSGKATAVTLPKGFAFVAWLPDQRFVGIMPGRSSADDRLVILRPGESGEIAVPAVDTAPYLARVTADGKWLVGLHADGARLPGKRKVKIVKVDLTTMTVTPLLTLTSFSGNEQPALSPDDKYVAYKRQMRMVNHQPQDGLFVGQRQIYSCPGPFDFRWVGERRIAVACQNEASVLDAKTGKTISHYRLPHTPSSQ